MAHEKDSSNERAVKPNMLIVQYVNKEKNLLIVLQDTLRPVLFFRTILIVLQDTLRPVMSFMKL